MKKSERYLRREAAVCAQYGYTRGCIVPGCDKDTKLHHIVPRRAGGTDAITNLVCICHTHEHNVHKAGHWARIQEADPTINIVNMARLSKWARKKLNRKFKTQGNESRRVLDSFGVCRERGEQGMALGVQAP